jgi:hypothetical protein
LIERYLNAKYRKPIKVKFSARARLGQSLDKVTKGETPKVRYDAEKVDYAREFARLMTPSDLDVLDLRECLDRVVSHIRRWNHLEPDRGDTTTPPT